ncbi:MAG: hypothetical protein AAFR36_16505, partial [Bacteroidota bacterium]
PMQDIEPFFRWRDRYIAARDERSPFYGRVYSEFEYSQTIYNYYIHPQWDNFGSATLYAKILFADYDQHYAIIELIGEWNDAVNNDVMFLKRELIDALMTEEIYRFIIIAENVLNFHGDEADYYEEWYEDMQEYNGWAVILNLQDHVYQEMRETQIDQYVHFGNIFNDINWRPHEPHRVYEAIEGVLSQETRRIY